eukprot:624854-Rhodomonas_salina.1
MRFRVLAFGVHSACSERSAPSAAPKLVAAGHTVLEGVDHWLGAPPRASSPSIKAAAATSERSEQRDSVSHRCPCPDAHPAAVQSTFRADDDDNDDNVRMKLHARSQTCFEPTSQSALPCLGLSSELGSEAFQQVYSRLALSQKGLRRIPEEPSS